MYLDFPACLQGKTAHSNFSLLLWTNLDIYLILVSTLLWILQIYSSNEKRRKALKTDGKLN